MRFTWFKIFIFSGFVVSPLCAESAKQWYEEGRAFVENAKRLAPVTGTAKNVILFIGDGMGISTVTAARILEGQQRGQTGEENLLSFEKLPFAALVKTYNTNQQVSDSAGTMTAIVTGVKSKAAVLSVDQEVIRGDAKSAVGHELTTIVELAEREGWRTGIVTNTNITDATPAACYGHTPERRWENDSALSAEAREAGFPDLARQLIEFSYGDGLEVALGGGRRHFMPNTASDSEETERRGSRGDGRDLTSEWLRKHQAAFVWNKQQFDALKLDEVSHLLGLFEYEEMEYETSRAVDSGGEPSLTEMTRTAIKILSRGPKGYFLMVEGGMIDHAHHAANAYRALTETIEFANAVRVAVEATDRKDTLIIVTADHSHVLTIGGYPTRGNPILGLVRGNNADGTPSSGFKKDALGLPYTTLTYANGPGYTGESSSQPEGPKQFGHAVGKYRCITRGRPQLEGIKTDAPEYLQECFVPLLDETHGGEDVPLYADGPMAHLFRGVMEQNVIFHVMIEAMGLTKSAESRP